MITSENLSTLTKLPICKNPEFINIGLEHQAMLDNITQTVNELNAHYARLDFEVKQRLKETCGIQDSIKRL